MRLCRAAAAGQGGARLTEAWEGGWARMGSWSGHHGVQKTKAPPGQRDPRSGPRDSPETGAQGRMRAPRDGGPPTAAATSRQLITLRRRCFYFLVSCSKGSVS